MKKNLTPNQEKLIQGLIDELVQVNAKCEAEKKASSKGPFDMSEIVKDIADKQRVVNENNALKTFWANRIKVQLESDVKKLNKALDKMGFFVETYAVNHDRKYPQRDGKKRDFYPRIYIVHKHLKNSSSYELDMEIDYVILHDNSKRADLDTPCGFKLRTKGLHSEGWQSSSGTDISTHTIEELFVKIQPWIKYYYERATLVTQ